MKQNANKKNPKTDFAELFVKAAYHFDATDSYSIPDELDDYVDDVCNGGIPNALASFEILAKLVTDLEQTPQIQENVLNAIYDYSVWTIYECNLNDQELAFAQSKYGDLIEQIRRDEEDDY